jgi:hypothetical protein
VNKRLNKQNRGGLSWGATKLRTVRSSVQGLSQNQLPQRLSRCLVPVNLRENADCSQQTASDDMANVEQQIVTSPPAKILIKGLLKRTAPRWLLELRRKYVVHKCEKMYANLSTREIFIKIYEEGAWGKSRDPQQKFCSGSGSHHAYIVDGYVRSVKKFLSSFEVKPNVVDLGCGDFYVGSQVRHLCNEYIACDIVPQVIEFNRSRYVNQNVDFRVLDFTRDELPSGDAVFLRQVLQHLSNEEIQKAIPQIVSKYRYLVLTEHIPSSNPFAHNIDKPVGPGTRVSLHSGVVLTSPPFNLRVKEDDCVWEVAEFGGLVRTNLYRI